MQRDPQPVASTSTAKPPTAIDPELFQRIQPGEYLSRFLEEDYRPDGRRTNEFREATFHADSITSAEGSALVRLGKTSVLCGIRVEIAEPDILAPNNGFFVPNVDLPPMCSSKFRPGPPSDEAQVLSNRIRNIVTSSSLLPLKALCIEPGKAAWVIYADLLCINYDGNVTDAALLALVAALRSTKLPEVRWDEDTEQALAIRDSSVNLPVGPAVLSASFGVTESGVVLPDLTSFEEPLCSAQVTVALNEEGKIVYVWQAGPSPEQAAGEISLISRCINSARQRFASLSSSLNADGGK